MDNASKTDWPEKPCLDMPPYSKSYLRAVWQEYHDFKGKEWMEMKKAEMDQAIRDGSLEEWIEHRSTPNNFANYNVYFYYYLNDQAPAVYEYSIVRDGVKPGIAYWHVSPVGIATMAGIGTAGTVVTVYLFRKNRQN